PPRAVSCAARPCSTASRSGYCGRRYSTDADVGGAVGVDESGSARGTAGEGNLGRGGGFIGVISGFQDFTISGFQEFLSFGDFQILEEVRGSKSQNPQFRKSLNFPDS